MKLGKVVLRLSVCAVGRHLFSPFNLISVFVAELVGKYNKSVTTLRPFEGGHWSKIKIRLAAACILVLVHSELL